MADRVTIKVLGLKELNNALRKMASEVQTKVLAASSKKGAKVLSDEVARRAPVLDLFDVPVSKTGEIKRFPGLLKRKILRTRAVRRGAETASFVSIKRLSKGAIRKFKQTTGKNASDNPDDPFYWKFVEFGTSKMEARPFIRSSFASKRGAAVEATKTELGRGIDRAVRKAAYRV